MSITALGYCGHLEAHQLGLVKLFVPGVNSLQVLTNLFSKLSEAKVKARVFRRP